MEVEALPTTVLVNVTVPPTVFAEAVVTVFTGTGKLAEQND